VLNPHEHIVGIECEHESDMPLARDVLEVLVRAYPGYHWFVLITGAVVRVSVSNWAANWGMVLHYSQVVADAGARAANVRRAAGEFLERATRIRGASTGERATCIEGVPQKAILTI
jgi:hypothetical protein